MNCSDVHQRLPNFLYGDADPQEASAIQEHLKDCQDCRKDQLNLQRLRLALDAVPAPAVTVDLQQVYQSASLRQARKLRRWRQAACALCALAALLLVAVFLRFEIRVEGHQLSVRWGAVPEVPQSSAPVSDDNFAVQNSPHLPPDWPKTSDIDERLQLMASLIDALTTEVDTHDANHQQEIARLRQRLDLLQASGDTRWHDTERDLAALYVAQFGSSQKGTRP
jgi:hypothetical protein